MYFPVKQSLYTRRSLNKLCLPNKNTTRGIKTLSYIGPRIWNNLSIFLKSARNLNIFKHRLKDSFFENLTKKEENIYHYS